MFEEPQESPSGEVPSVTHGYHESQKPGHLIIEFAHKEIMIKLTI